VLCDVIGAAAAAPWIQSATDRPVACSGASIFSQSADWGGFIYAGRSRRRRCATILRGYSDCNVAVAVIDGETDRTAGADVGRAAPTTVERIWNKLPPATAS